MAPKNATNTLIKGEASIGQTDLWVFAYGSLIWNPGFDAVEQRPARLYGLHRSFCVWSWHWRGTREKPGLVLGLDYGGSATGIAFRVPKQDAREVRHYLRAREQVTMVYREGFYPITLDDGEKVMALTYPVNRAHDQYAGRLPIAQQVQIMESAHGIGGPNRDYLLQTCAALQKNGIKDKGLEKVAAHFASAQNQS